jgi:hypothetical protein
MSQTKNNWLNDQEEFKILSQTRKAKIKRLEQELKDLTMILKTFYDKPKDNTVDIEF